MTEYKQNLYDLRKSVDKSSIVFILESRISEIHEDLEDIRSTESETAAYRGGILEIRSLLDLING
jgi:hypothetical protein